MFVRIMRIFITGGTGFLGAHLARRVLKDGAQVRVVGRNQRVLAELENAGAEAVCADVRDASAMKEACRGADVVVHAAALSSAWGTRAEFWQTNVVGTQNMARACESNNVKRLIYVSSASVVFGGRDLLNMNEQTPFPRRFASLYCETKKRGEDIVNEANARGLDTVIVRPKAIFGADDPSLWPRVLRAARANRLFQIGDGTNLIDLTHVDNVVEALVLALENPAARGQTYFVSSAEPTSLWPTIRRVLGEVGLPDQLRTVPLRAAYSVAWLMERRALLSRREPLLTRFSVLLLARSQTCDIAKARRELGYKPTVSVEEGIERTLEAWRHTKNTPF